MIGISPKDAIELKDVPLVSHKNYALEDILPEDGLYHYLLQPEEEHNGQCKTASNRILSMKTYRLREVIENAGNQVIYYLSDGPERAFVSEELMLIPKDTENIYPTGIDISNASLKLFSSFQNHQAVVLFVS